jgi:multimeric flavodoxin WrbA
MKTLIINGSPVKQGATAEITSIIAGKLSNENPCETVCLGDLEINFCTGCRSCHTTAVCHIKDGVNTLLEKMDEADCIVFVVPSYWADVPGQLKVFFDRCTPYSNTHQPHLALKPGKTAYAIALRTGLNEKECLNIIESIRHYCGHMEIGFIDSFCMCGINGREDIISRSDEIMDYCHNWFKNSNGG